MWGRSSRSTPRRAWVGNCCCQSGAGSGLGMRGQTRVPVAVPACGLREVNNRCIGVCRSSKLSIINRKQYTTINVDKLITNSECRSNP